MVTQKRAGEHTGKRTGPDVAIPADGDSARASAASRPRGREEAEAAIVAAATRLFAAHGPSQVTMQQIADAAGVNRGLLHRHFGSRDDVVSAVFASVSQRAARSVDPGAPLPVALADMRALSTESRYAHLLAWAILTDNAPTEAVPSAPIRALLDLDESARATDVGVAHADRVRVAVATTFATSLGWQLFGPFLTENAGLSHLTPDELFRRVGDAITRSLSAELQPRPDTTEAQ